MSTPKGRPARLICNFVRLVISITVNKIHSRVQDVKNSASSILTALKRVIDQRYRKVTHATASQDF
jgi:hypothetical protein